MNPEYHVKHSFSDLPSHESMVWATKMGYHAAGSFNDQLTYLAYKHIPVTYVLCSEDMVVVPESQRRFIDTMTCEGAEVEVITCNAGHCVMVSQPDVVVQAINLAAGEH